jgi:hypothetical protein
VINIILINLVQNPSNVICDGHWVVKGGLRGRSANEERGKSNDNSSLRYLGNVQVIYIYIYIILMII